MQYARLPVGKPRKNRVTDKESKGFAYLCTNLNDWGMSDIFNSSHFLRALMKSYQASQENQGAAEISWGSRRGKHCTLQICCFYLFTFYLFTFWDGRTDLEEGNSHFGYWEGKSIAHCKSLDFTFLPFTFLPFEDRTEQSAGLIQRRRVHGPPVMDWVHPAIRDRVDVL